MVSSDNTESATEEPVKNSISKFKNSKFKNSLQDIAGSVIDNVASVAGSAMGNVASVVGSYCESLSNKSKGDKK